MPFIDARDLPGGSEIVADLVIIGGGLAGLALAREWAGGGRSVAVLESGGRTPDPATQDLYRGEGVMRAPGGAAPFSDYVVQSRVRMLGGSGNVWGGKCVALDPADFAERSWVPGSGWPVTRAQMQPWYDRASDLLELPHFPAGEADLELADRPAVVVDGRRRWFSAARHFSKFSGGRDKAAFDRWRSAPAEAANVTVYLNINVTELKLAADRRTIERLDLAGLDGKRMTARGRTYVLATGGIENVRLLLASNSVAKAGVGNDNDLVGRHFQGHVTFSMNEAATGRATSVFFSGGDNDLRLYTEALQGQSHCVFAPTLASQRERRAGNATVTLYAFRNLPSADAEGAALREAALRLDGPAKAREVGCFLMTEHMPNPESRITLGSTSDALGVPRVKLDWVWSEADWRSLESSINAFGQALGAAGLGRMVFPADRAGFLNMAKYASSRHHMGTTRMHRDPAKGVVDENSRVHGVSNLYVAGSSVFPTSGIGNPTLTLLAMTMRLSEHLKRAA